MKWIIKISCRLKPICWKYTAAAIFHFFILDAYQHTSCLKSKSSFLPPLFRSKGVFDDKVFARARQICSHITVWQKIKVIRAKNAENHIEVREEKMENTARVLSIISRFLHILRLNAHLTAYTIANALGKVYNRLASLAFAFHAYSWAVNSHAAWIMRTVKQANSRGGNVFSQPHIPVETHIERLGTVSNILTTRAGKEKRLQWQIMSVQAFL